MKRYFSRVFISIILFFIISNTSVSTASESTIDLPGDGISYSSLAVADFNNDGYKEIVAAGHDGMLYILSTNDGVNWGIVWSHQCNNDLLSANPPTPKTTTIIESSPAIADLDNDGHLDIVIALGGDVHSSIYENRYNGGVLVYRYNQEWNFALIESLSVDGQKGWPQPRIDRVGWPPPGHGEPDGFWDGIATTPALGDLDGDGDLEIVVGGIDLRFHAWHHTGEAVDGWPITGGHADGGLSSPALGDLDQDQLPEIVLGTKYTDGKNFWALNGDGSNLPGFPLITEQFIHSSPVLADVDKDGQLEIIVGSGWGDPPGGGGRVNLVYIWNHDGTPLPNWPRETAGVTSAPPSIGDIDNDGDLEIVVGCGWHVDNRCHTLYAWNVDGSLVPGFPLDPPSPNPWLQGAYAMPYTPILADIDGDERVEILISHQGARGFTTVELTPNGIATDNTSYYFAAEVVSTPLVDDIDNDGLLEILLGGKSDTTQKGVIKIWHENGSSNAELPWPMFRRNVQRTALFGSSSPSLNISQLTLLHHEDDVSPTEQGSFTLLNNGSEAFAWRVIQQPTQVSLSSETGTVNTSTTITVSVDVSSLSSGWTELGNIVLEADNQIFEIPVRVYIGPLNRVYLPMVVK